MVCYSSWHHQNVQEPDEAFLVAWDEEACGYIYFTVCDLPADQSRASEAVWVVAVVGGTVVEVGAYYDGLCGWIAKVTGRT